MKKVTEQFPDDVEAWIELAGILEENNVTVRTVELYYCTLHALVFTYTCTCICTMYLCVPLYMYSVID